MDLCEDLGRLSVGTDSCHLSFVVRATDSTDIIGCISGTNKHFRICLSIDPTIIHSFDWSDHCCLNKHVQPQSARMDARCRVPVFHFSYRPTPAAALGLSIVFLRIDFQQHESHHRS